CLSAMITYLLYVFMASYATQVVGLPFVQTSIVATLALLGTTLLVPIGGYLSDRIGRRRCLLWSTSVFVLLSYPLFLLISHGNFTSFVIAEIIFVLIGSCFQGALPATVFEMVPTQVRYSVVAVGYNVSYSIFGGTAPLVASYLVTVSGDNAAPGWYLMAGAVVALLAAWRLR
ncbi:MAG TPA: MFS transporter, partial [Gammaproteobacteria bacterium]|nr:MFS transporter [Gammaproteobacteria bacterium]